MRPIYICLLLILGSCKPEFELKIPKPSLTTKIQKENNALDFLYDHMVSNYDTISSKKYVKKLDLIDYRVCSFTQEFEYKIKFSTESCNVSEGLNMSIKFPKVPKDQVTEWIERINESMSIDNENIWDANKKVYKPNDDQAGCYYELMEDDNEWNVIIWCGT
jgi:hypothetical protein